MWACGQETLGLRFFESWPDWPCYMGRNVVLSAAAPCCLLRMADDRTEGVMEEATGSPVGLHQDSLKRKSPFQLHGVISKGSVLVT